MCRRIGGFRLWVQVRFSSSAQYVLFVLLRCFVGWEISHHAAANLLGAAFRICWKPAASFFNSHLAFFPSVSLNFRWCGRTIALTITAWKNFCFILSKRLDIHVVDRLVTLIYWYILCCALILKYVLLTSPPPVGCNTIFMQSIASLNSEFSFSKTGCHIKAQELCLHSYLTITDGGKKRWFQSYNKSISMKWNTNSLVQDLNSGCWFYFLWWLLLC